MPTGKYMIISRTNVSRDVRGRILWFCENTPFKFRNTTCHFRIRSRRGKLFRFIQQKVQSRHCGNIQSGQGIQGQATTDSGSFRRTLLAELIHQVLISTSRIRNQFATVFRFIRIQLINQLSRIGSRSVRSIRLRISTVHTQQSVTDMSQFLIQIHTQTHTLLVVTRQTSSLLGIIGGYIIGSLFASAPNAYIMFLIQIVANQLFEPICIDIPQFVQLLFPRRNQLRQVRIARIVFIVVISTVTISRSLRILQQPFQLQFLRWVHHRHAATTTRRDSHVQRISNHCLPADTSLRSDFQYSVGSLDSIQGTGSRILQHLYFLDVHRV